ncbi:MAG: C4-type zinc ribbon domain-containing protein [Actinomycetes bacterium]
MSILVHLYDLQMLDTTLEQLRHHFITLPEREALAVVQKNIADCASQISSGEMRQQELEKLLNVAEATSAALRKKRERLEQQMKTVIAPREAEALQHEILTVNTELNTADEESLAFMEESEHIDSTLVAARAALVELRTAEVTATAALHEAEEYKKAEARDVEEKRQRLAETLDEKWSAAYELRRSQHKGIAVAKVKNHVCGGCHLDLSTSEVDLLKKETDENRECPNCARWLVF